MSTLKFKGEPIHLTGELTAVGSKAPDFTYVKTDLSEAKLSDLQAKVKVLIAVPSLDTGTCKIETKQFNQRMADKEGVQALVISQDLPFAMRRFCETEGIANVECVSDFRYKQFMQLYNTEMKDGKLRGLSARVVFVLNKDNVIRYTQLVPEVSAEPNYEEVMDVVDALLKA